MSYRSTQLLRHNLIPRENFEVWDLGSGKADFILDISELEKAPPNRERPYLADARYKLHIPATVCRDFVLTRSLDDGSSLQVLSMPADTLGPVRISPDGRYLLYNYYRRLPLTHLADGRNDRLERWLWEQFCGQERLALLELRTGKTWLNLSDVGRCTFTNDGAGWTSFGDEGRYEYDLPPRWQYFTPWAWVALGAWLSLAGIWWTLRIRRPRGGGRRLSCGLFRPLLGSQGMPLPFAI